MSLYPDVIRHYAEVESRERVGVLERSYGRPSANLDALWSYRSRVLWTLIVVNPLRAHTPLLFQSFLFSTFAILLAHRATAVGRPVSYHFFILIPLHFGLRLQLTSIVKMWNGHLFSANEIMK